MNYFLAALRKYATFSGRARRSEYWYFVLFNIIFATVAIVLDNLFNTTFTFDTEYGRENTLQGYFYLFYCLAFFLPSLAVIVRRLHDTGKSGAYILVSLIPLAGAIWLLVLLFTESTPGVNKYGANPKGIGNFDEIEEIGSDIQDKYMVNKSY